VRLLLLSLALTGLAGCGTIPQKPPNLSGQWGGPHISLLLEGGLGTVEFDCAAGTIDSAIFPAPDGRFSTVGTYRAGKGGPVRVGQIFQSQRATYSGTVTKTAMTLSLRLEDGQTLGPYTLTQGAPGELTRCL